MRVDSRRGWGVWQVLDANTGVSVDYEEWLKRLASYDIVYVGEEHYNQYHVEAALKVLDSLVSHGARPVIAMEMFGWDGQAALDHYLKTEDRDRTRFIQESQWMQNWGGAYEDYEPLVQFAQQHRLVLRALNPPKALVRNVVKLGLAKAKEEPLWSQWSMRDETIVDDPAYRDKILRQLQECHGGGSPEDYETMYEASMVRDEAMAKALVTLLTEEGAGLEKAGPILSYTGGGHIQYRLPVPKRVARRKNDEVRQVTVYLTSFEASRTEEIRHLMAEGIADYVWLTPVSEKGPPRRCR
ncbi:MAG: ChaN family lipoprotein [Nitrospiraceae bacterium]